MIIGVQAGKQIACHCSRCGHDWTELARQGSEQDPFDWLLTLSCPACDAVEPITFSKADADHE